MLPQTVVSEHDPWLRVLDLIKFYVVKQVLKTYDKYEIDILEKMLSREHNGQDI